MLRYPAFDTTEFNCLNEDLSVVDFVLKLEEAEKNLKVWEAEKAKLNNQYGTEGHSLMVFLQNRILEYRDKIPEEVRQQKLKNQVEQFRRCMKMPRSFANNTKINSIVGEIQYLYGSFNNELFESELNDLLADEIKEVGDLEKVYAKVNGHIGQWKKKRNALWKDVATIFKENTLPKAFGIRTTTEYCSEMEIAEAVVLTFAQKWRRRACCFDRPVSIYGTDINTMPKDRKKVWWDAYQKMELHDDRKYPKRPMYAALKSKEKDPLYVENKTLTGKFAGAVKQEDE